MPKSRHRQNGKRIRIGKGLYLYRTHASPYYLIQIRNPNSAKTKYLVRSSKVENVVDARRLALEYADDLSKQSKPVSKSLLFEHFADQLVLTQDELVKNGMRHPVLAKLDKGYLYNDKSGLVTFFKGRDVSTIKTKDAIDYLTWVRSRRPDIVATSSINHIISCFRKVLKIARDEGVINEIPAVPRPKRHDNPRPFFRFHPLVGKKDDEYQKLLKAAKSITEKRVVVHGSLITDEMYDFILFQAHSFLRPTTSEVFALRHRDVAIANKPRRLMLTVAEGKTGFRVVNTMEAAASVYERICKRYPDHKPADFIFLPSKQNRTTASTILGRQFREVAKRADLEQDRYAKQPHTLYSLRHTSICMRLVLSKGLVNIFSLAKNAGTSVDQIERFYASKLPLVGEMVTNLQSFGGAA